MSFEIAQAFDQVAICRLDSLDIPPAIFHDVSLHSFYTASHCTPSTVNDFNLVILCTLDKPCVKFTLKRRR